MARPTIDDKDKRDKVQTFRCTVAERLRILDNATNAGKTVSDFQREACLYSVVVNRKNAVDIETASTLNRIGSELNKSGSNINQLAKYAHNNRHINPVYMQSVLDKHESLLQELEKHLDALMGFSE